MGERVNVERLKLANWSLYDRVRAMLNDRGLSADVEEIIVDLQADYSDDVNTTMKDLQAFIQTRAWAYHRAEQEFADQMRQAMKPKAEVVPEPGLSTLGRRIRAKLQQRNS